MPHGTPDWGLIGPKSITFGLDDLGEHAVRLGSPHLWDRRGDVLYITDFREGLGALAAQAIGAGGEVNLSTGLSRQGAYCVRLRTGSTLSRLALLQMLLGFQDWSVMGLEFSFGVPVGPTLMAGYFQWADAANSYDARVVYDFALAEVRYFTTGSAWAVLQAGVILHLSTRPEHTMKMVVDMDRREYVRFLLDELAWDMRGTPIDVVALPGLTYRNFRIVHTSPVAINYDAFVDNVIITQNEPR